MSNMNWPRLMRGKMKARTNITLLLAGILAGCGGGDEGSDIASPLPPSPVGSVTAVDGFGAVRPNTSTRVDLSAFVRGPGATLTTLESIQPECNASKLSGLTAEVTIDGGGLCEYSFTASNGASDASASLNMLASTKASPVLPPLSQAMTLGSGNTTYDLQALLGADWPSGYSLDASSLQVQGGTVQGSATASGNTITYTPPTTPDWNRILFILKNPSKPTEDALGTIYVTVSDRVNQAPVIGNSKYDYKAETGTTVVTFRSQTIDLAALPALDISDPEGAEWQLVEVQSYSATVTPVDPTSVTNKRFTFTAGTIGTHIVSYIVGDHEGGFTMGLMNITVGPEERVKDWVDIALSGAAMTFYATPLYSEVASKGLMAEASWDSGVNLASNPPGNTIAKVTGAGALSYCRGLGYRLPTQANLDVLRTTGSADTLRAKYPKQLDYLVSNDSGASYLTYNLASGVTAPYIPGTTPNQYVMCMKYADDGKMVYSARPNTPFTGYYNTAISDGSWQVLGDLTSDGGAIPIVSVTTDAGPSPLSDSNVRLNPVNCVGGSACVLEARADLTEYGDIKVQLVNGRDSSRTLDVDPVTFWQNAKLTGLRTGVNNSTGNGTAENTVIATLQDKDGNPVPDTQVKLTYRTTPSTGITLNPPSQAGGTAFTTDANGEVMLTLRSSNGAGAVQVTMDPVISGIPTGSQSIDSTFKADIYGPTDGCHQGVVTLNGLNYACPLTKTEADARGVGYASTFTAYHPYGISGKIYVLMTKPQVENYCSNLGNGNRVPTLNELQSLYAAHGNMYFAFGWPVLYSYWTSTIIGDIYSSAYRLIGLNDGSVWDVSTNNSNYASLPACVR